MLIKMKEKVTEIMIGMSLLLSRKAVEERGDANSMSQSGWAYVAIGIVLVLYGFMPDKISDFVKAVFTKLNTGLGL